MKDLSVSVLIPTYKRSKLLKHVFDALTTQSNKNFEVLVIIRPSGDGTEELVRTYAGKLEIKSIIQKSGHFLDALNLGLDNAKGELILFLDDDAIPSPNWIQAYISRLSSPNVGGIAGNVITATLIGEKVVELKNESSEVIPPVKAEKLTEFCGRKIWNKPLTGLESYYYYISKAGVVSKNKSVVKASGKQLAKSLMGMGANMGVKADAVKDFRFSSSSILGPTNEQTMGWYLWKKGFDTFIDPEIRVHHISHGQTLSRNIKETRRDILRWTEQYLLFYRLYAIEPELSAKHRLIWLVFDSIIDLKRLLINKEISRLNRFKAKFYSETIGFKWLLCNKFHTSYSPLKDLNKIVR
jgi:glycosyltransferase involved in cell wall biosynthesis